MKFSNPRTFAEFENWPIGRDVRGRCKFEVESDSKRGYRVAKTTTNQHGIWCKPKKDTYAGMTAIVTGDDGRTYILKEVRNDCVYVLDHNFKHAGDIVWRSTNAARFNELTNMIEQAYEPKEM